MKKILLLAIILSTAICASAQQYKVYKDNGTSESLRMNSIDSIIFKTQGRLPKVMFYKNNGSLQEISVYDIDSIKVGSNPNDCYERIDYIWNNANMPHVDLGTTFKTNTRVQVKYYYIKPDGSVVIGDEDGTNDISDLRWFVYDNHKLCLDFPGGSGDGNRIQYNDFDKTKVHEHEFGNFYIKDLTNGKIIANSSALTFKRTTNLCLWPSFSSTSKDMSSREQVRIYYIKIFEGDKLVKDFIPVRYKDEFGLWDLVEDEFHGTTNDNKILGAGSDIENDILYYDYITGLENATTGCIDTDVFLTQNYEIDMEFYFKEYLYNRYDQYLFHAGDDKATADAWFNDYGLYGECLVSSFGDWTDGWNHLRISPGRYNLQFKDKGYVYDLNNRKELLASASKRTFKSSQSLKLLYAMDGHDLVQIGHTSVYDNSVLLLDLYPCKYNDQIGMYDKVNGKFYPLTGRGKVGYWNGGDEYEGGGGQNAEDDDNDDGSNFDITKYVSVARTGQGTKVDSSGAYYTVTFSITNSSNKTIHLSTLGGADISRDLGPGQTYSVTLQSQSSSLQQYYQELVYTYNGKAYRMQG